MKFSMYKFKAMAPVMALFQKQPLLPFKQDYDNLRLHRQKSALGSDTARSGRCFHRNQSAVSTSHNVPSDSYDIALVQRLLQHSSAAITQRYIGMEPQRIERAIEGHAQLI